jgi:exopolyphosphatase/guanosine-5'-triphosphate,3'-diphosphate pyrophosphatase
MTGPVVAAIDNGTNSTRLLISEGGVVTLDRRMNITRLGQGVDQSGRLAPEAIDRVLTVLREYRGAMDEAGVERVRATATSAARDAANRDDFFGPAEEILGVPLELLSGEEEGRLSFLGGTAELDPANGPFLVADIGGGSTELIVGTDEPEAVHSLDVGCVRLTERFIENDPAKPEELVACLSLVEAHLDGVLRESPVVGDAKTFVGQAGTVASAAAVEIGLPVYDRDRIHHFVLEREAVEDVFRTLATENRDERMGNPGMEEGRVDVIVGGLCVLVQLMRQYDFDECLVSESDILDGLARSIAT